MTEWLLAIGFYTVLLTVLAGLLHYFASLLIRQLVRHFGRPLYLLIASIGVPLHELSHVIMCIVFGHKIHRVVWFSPVPARSVHGFVEHSWSMRPWPMVGNFFIGIAPLLFGSTWIYIMALLLLPDGDGLIATTNELLVVRSPMEFLLLLRVAFDELILNWILLPGRTTLFITLVVTIGIFMIPSRADLKHCVEGAMVVGVITLALHFLMPTLTASLYQWCIQATCWVMVITAGVLVLVTVILFSIIAFQTILLIVRNVLSYKRLRDQNSVQG